MCIIDLGHNATHVVPVKGDAIIWSAVRRHVISQRILTNLLKETLSFRQWDMMDEPWLVGHIKERCCFVASTAGRRGDAIDMEMNPPSSWSYAGMLEMCQSLPHRKNPVVVEYILPDYSASSKEKLGYVRGNRGAKGPVEDLNTFIAGSSNFTSILEGRQKRNIDQKDGSDDEDDEESDDDFREGSPDEPASKKQKRPKKKAAVEKRQEDEESEEQVLVLERERFQIPEVMFDPGIIGLEDAPLHQVIEASIKACDEDLQGLLWANIVLVGGGAKLAGLKQRVYVFAYSDSSDYADVFLHVDSTSCGLWHRQMCPCKCGWQKSESKCSFVVDVSSSDHP
jgi:actin-related protein 6